LPAGPQVDQLSACAGAGQNLDAGLHLASEVALADLAAAVAVHLLFAPVGENQQPLAAHDFVESVPLPFQGRVAVHQELASFQVVSHLNESRQFHSLGLIFLFVLV